MSRPSLFAEPRETETTDKKFLKRIDELIDESEIEAMAEIDKQIRYKNAKFALIALIAVGLAALLYLGIENQSLPGMTGGQDQTAAVDSKETASPELAPLNDTPANEVTSEESATTPGPAGEDKESSLEDMEQQAAAAINEALSTMNESETPAASEEQPETTAAVEPEKPAPQPEPKAESNALPSNPPSGNFYVQVGAFSVKANADRMVKKLKGANLPTQVTLIEGKASKYTLAIGGFSSPDSGQFLMKELKGKGYSPQLVPKEDGNYAIVVKQTDSRSKAEAMKQQLGEDGIFTQIQQMNVSTPIHVVRVGGFASKDLAARYKKEIAKLGYPKTLIRKISQPAG